MDITVFLGAPGSGKGTQAKRLAESQGFRHLSTGDMLRAAIQEGTDVGKRAKGFIDRGELVPDSIMIELIADVLAKSKGGAKVILDGFPRTVPQAKALDENKNTMVNKALYFDMPEKMLVERLTGRRICEKCGEPFHVSFLPSKKSGICDKCGGKLIQRADDDESVVTRRLQIFNQQNSQLLDYYRARKNLSQVTADAPVEQVQKSLTKILS